MLKGCFYIDGYAAKGNRLDLHYALEEPAARFCESLIFPPDFEFTASPALEQAIAVAQLALGISYYKAACPPVIEVCGFAMTEQSKLFWTDFYRRGLGEMLYKNGLPLDLPLSFKAADDYSPAALPARPQKLLLPFGGGKDSLLSALMLRDFRPTLFTVKDSSRIAAAAEALDMQRIVIERRIDPRLLELNKRGALNGHVPITGMVSAIAVVTAVLGGFTDIVMSLESSSDSPQLVYDGIEVNHQYSKTSRFERSFSECLTAAGLAPLSYYSLLRPLSELGIAKRFVEQAHSFTSADLLALFTSCNTNFSFTRGEPVRNWCGECPKCASIFLLFAPFLSEEELVAVFKKDLFADSGLVPLYRGLLGLDAPRPFECIGTVEESRAALSMVAAQRKFPGRPVLELSAAYPEPHGDCLRLGSLERIPAAFHSLLRDKR